MKRWFDVFIEIIHICYYSAIIKKREYYKILHSQNFENTPHFLIIGNWLDAFVVCVLELYFIVWLLLQLLGQYIPLCKWSK